MNNNDECRREPEVDHAAPASIDMLSLEAAEPYRLISRDAAGARARAGGPFWRAAKS